MIFKITNGKRVFFGVERHGVGGSVILEDQTVDLSASVERNIGKRD
jgi:hypothetical protein